MKRFEPVVWWLFVIWWIGGVFNLIFYHGHLPSYLRWADAFFIILAALNILFPIVQRDGRKRALCSFGIVTLGSALIEFIGETTDWPFGSYDYTSQLGWKIAGVLPFTIPLAWWSIIGSGQYIIQKFKIGNKWLMGLFVGIYAVGMDYLLEPFAYRVNDYWRWSEGVIPMQNYLAWFCISLLLGLLFPWEKQLLVPSDKRPYAVAILMATLFVIGRIFG